MAKVLLVEDDPLLSDNITEWLKQHHVVEVVDDGIEALDRLRFYQFDVCVLDWMIPGLVGVEVCKQFRALGGTTPILLLTGKRSVPEKEEGLDCGADDYLTKPFHLQELSARLRALLRRNPVVAMASNVLKCGDLELNTQDHSVTKNGEQVSLLPREFSLLEFLLRHPNEVFSAESLLDRVWDSTSDVSPDSIRTYVARLRAKIDDKNAGQSIIHNVHGIGYKLVID